MSTSGIHIVRGEANALAAHLVKSRRSPNTIYHEKADLFLCSLSDLKDVLNNVHDLSEVSPQVFLSPFLEIIRSQETSETVTEAALSSVNLFLNYGLIKANNVKSAQAVEEIADTATNTKFVGNKNPQKDQCVLFKILQVLRSLLLSPAGRLLSNEAACNMMQSCFRICFEKSFPEILRKAAESTLVDMTQLIFTLLPQFKEDARHPYIQKLIMNAGYVKGSEKRRRRMRKRADVHSGVASADDENDVEVIGMVNKSDLSTSSFISPAASDGYSVSAVSSETALMQQDLDIQPTGSAGIYKDGETGKAYTNVQADAELPLEAEDVLRMPYGLPCARELLRFLITLINPLERENTEQMIVFGLNLLIVAFECSADYLSHFELFLPLIKNELSRAVLQLLATEKLPIFASTTRLAFLLFESCRKQLKFQLEAYLYKLRSIVASEQSSVSYEKKELALESIVCLWRIPAFMSELYLNYDTNWYCGNLFEDLIKLFVENAFPVNGLQSITTLSLEALLLVNDFIQRNIQFINSVSFAPPSATIKSLQMPFLGGIEVGFRELYSQQSESKSEHKLYFGQNRHYDGSVPEDDSAIANRKKLKKKITDGTALFNQDPKKGINFMLQSNLINDDPASVVQWLRENPKLDKKMIADYICNRKHAPVLEYFVKSFCFENTRIDEALRMFFEAFRLPGDAAEISMVMENFSSYWYSVNHEPFEHPDAAYTLSYAIIMLNTDQHNPQVRRNQPPMTVDCFIRNLSGTNGNTNFDSELLEQIYEAIKHNEIVMPAEHTGVVKENYLWKDLLRRSETKGEYVHVGNGWNDRALFNITWGPAIAAFSYIFDKCNDDAILQKTLDGYRKCASIAASFEMSNVLDNLIIHLCKFSTLMPHGEGSPEISQEAVQPSEEEPSELVDTVAVNFGSNSKAQSATRLLFEIILQNGCIVEEGWRSIIVCLLHLYRARLLPKEFTLVKNYATDGFVSIERDTKKRLIASRSDNSLLSWFGLGTTATHLATKQRPPAFEQNIKAAKACIAEIDPFHIVINTRNLSTVKLMVLIDGIIKSCTAIQQQFDNLAKIRKHPEMEMSDEDDFVFLYELLVMVLIKNSDRISVLWEAYFSFLIAVYQSSLRKCIYLIERVVVGHLQVVECSLGTELTAVADNSAVRLQSLEALLLFHPSLIYLLSRQIVSCVDNIVVYFGRTIDACASWVVIGNLLKCAGALAPFQGQNTATSASDESVLTDPTTTDNCRSTSSSSTNVLAVEVSDDVGRNAAGSTQDWIMLDRDDSSEAQSSDILVLKRNLGRHDPTAFFKCCSTTYAIVNNFQYASMSSLDLWIDVLLTLGEASFNGGLYAAGSISAGFGQPNPEKTRKTVTPEPKRERPEEKERELSSEYAQATGSILALCLFLSNKLISEGNMRELFDKYLKNILKLLCKFAFDCRRLIRLQSLSILQRIVLCANFDYLAEENWNSLFVEVIFPYLRCLTSQFSIMDPLGMEETRIRALQLASKIILNHLNSLSNMQGFSIIWEETLAIFCKFLNLARNDSLTDAVPETLKNMVLVFKNQKLFISTPGLYDLTHSSLVTVMPILVTETLEECRPPTTDSSVSTAISPTSSVVTTDPASAVLLYDDFSLSEVVVHSAQCSTPSIATSGIYGTPGSDIAQMSFATSSVVTPASASHITGSVPNSSTLSRGNSSTFSGRNSSTFSRGTSNTASSAPTFRRGDVPRLHLSLDLSELRRNMSEDVSTTESPIPYTQGSDVASVDLVAMERDARILQAQYDLEQEAASNNSHNGTSDACLAASSPQDSSDHSTRQ